MSKPIGTRVSDEPAGASPLACLIMVLVLLGGALLVGGRYYDYRHRPPAVGDVYKHRLTGARALICHSGTDSEHWDLRFENMQIGQNWPLDEWERE